MLDFAQFAVQFEELIAKIPKPAPSDLKRKEAYLECQQKAYEYLKSLKSYFDSDIRKS